MFSKKNIHKCFFGSYFRTRSLLGNGRIVVILSAGKQLDKYYLDFIKFTNQYFIYEMTFYPRDWTAKTRDVVLKVSSTTLDCVEEWLKSYIPENYHGKYIPEK